MMKKLKIIFAVLSMGLFIYSCSKEDQGTPDPKVSLKITTESNIVSETSATVSFTLTLSAALSSPTTVNFTVSGTAINGTDYEKIGNTVVIPANSTTAKIDITILEDTIVEDTETIIITLKSTNNDHVTIASPNSATISITDSTSAFILLPEDTSNYMVNPNSTPETIALFYNLKTLSKTKFIVGQQDAFNSFYNNNAGESDMKKTTGSDPGLLGSDFMFITDDKNDGSPSNWFYQQEQIIKANVVEAYDKGMVNVFCWHLREPFEGEDFYTSEMSDFQKSNAFISILPGGENHDYYKRKLQKVAEVAKSMTGSDGTLIPFVFRPFHEFDGDWFWWGASYCTPQQYKTLWQFTVDYLKDDLNVRNILYAYSPDKNFTDAADYLSRYPGDNYVDILGMDNYGDFDNMGQMALENANQKMQIISKLAIEKVKICALTETCFFVTPGQTNPISNFYTNNLYNVLTNNDIEVAFMMFWNNSQDTYCIPVPGVSGTADFIAFANKPRAVLQTNLPKMYQLP